MATRAEQIKAMITGRQDCGRCGGNGWEHFEGVQIVCGGCNSEESIAAYWKSVDSMLSNGK